MKTMLELLIRLQEMRRSCRRVKRNPQLTSGEKTAAYSQKQIVRECLPPEVLVQYDQMKKTEHTLANCPEVFAMAVLVSTYQSMPPHRRKKLVAHFTTPPPAQSRSTRRIAKVKGGRIAARRFKVKAGAAGGEPWRQ
jgi:hypothetical protein